MRGVTFSVTLVCVAITLLSSVSAQLRPRCPVPLCVNDCPYGRQLNAKGCPSCVCIVPPRNPCANYKCGNNQMCITREIPCDFEPCPLVARCVPWNYQEE